MRKTIVFYHPSSELYGADKILVYVMKNYVDYNKILVLSTYGPLIELVNRELPDVEIKIIPTVPIIAKKNLTPKGIFIFLYSLISFPTKIKSLTNVKPDIVYLNTLAVVPILFFYSSIKVKKIVHIHEILKNNSIFHRIINKIALKYSDVLVCVSEAVKINMEAALPEMKNKLQLIHNGINFKTENIYTTNPLNFKENRINFALIGRIKPTHKGQNLLLDAIAKLDQEYLEKVHFYFVGSPVPNQEYMLKQVQDKILSLTLTDYVDIIPFVKKIEQVYEKVDVVIVPSVFDDPFPTTVLEGMYFSKPIIGTNVGGIPEMIEDTITGFIVERDNTQELCDKIMYFIENPEKIKEMGNKGKIRFSKNFSEESFNERYSNMLKTIQ